MSDGAVAPDDGDENAGFGWALPPFATLVASLGDIGEGEPGDGDSLSTDRGDLMEIERVTLSLAIELSVEGRDDGSLRVRGSTPTQWTETTIMPAFHKLTLRIAKNDDGEE